MRREAASPEATVPLIIAPTHGWIAVGLDELWSYRELLYFLAWRDVKVRYKQTLLGASWAILHPLVTMVVFTVFFGRIAQVGSDGLPYPIFSAAGILPWNLFANGISQVANSLVGSANLIRKVYFPRLVTPLASVAAGFVDFGVALLLLMGLMVHYRIAPGLPILLLPLFLGLGLAACLGVGLWLSALNAEYRDIRHLVPFLIQLLLFASPVIYPASRVTEKLQEAGLPAWLYGLNPFAGAIQGFRYAVLGSQPPWLLMAPGTVVAALLLTSGLFYFRRMERRFADRL